MELVLPMYNTHPYFSLKNLRKSMHIIHDKIRYISKYFGTWHASIHLENAIFLILINRKLKKQFACTRQKQQSSFTVLHITSCSVA